jgi:response regulator RpfG family c-di-GMP phosphodiesterase
VSPLSPLTPSGYRPSKKPRMLIVDDEPINLDLLYRTFYKDFKVLRAESGTAALEILSREGEVAVIISDQRMPGMRGTEFLSKTVSDFPDTIRMILTGFTDGSDLVDAINSGQVYRYVTKPWDPDELMHSVTQASAVYDLLKRQHESLHYGEKQSKLTTVISQVISQSIEKNDALTFLATGFGQILRADAYILLLTPTCDIGCYGQLTGEQVLEAAKTNELLQAAISTQSTQVATQLQSDETRASHALYAGKAECHLAYPILYRQEALGVLSLQWNTPYSKLDDVTQLLDLTVPLLAAVVKTAII